MKWICQLCPEDSRVDPGEGFPDSLHEQMVMLHLHLVHGLGDTFTLVSDGKGGYTNESDGRLVLIVEGVEV